MTEDLLKRIETAEAAIAALKAKINADQATVSAAKEAMEKLANLLATESSAASGTAHIASPSHGFFPKAGVGLLTAVMAVFLLFLASLAVHAVDKFFLKQSGTNAADFKLENPYAFLALTLAIVAYIRSSPEKLLRDKLAKFNAPQSSETSKDIKKLRREIIPQLMILDVFQIILAILGVVLIQRDLYGAYGKSVDRLILLTFFGLGLGLFGLHLWRNGRSFFAAGQKAFWP